MGPTRGQMNQLWGVGLFCLGAGALLIVRAENNLASWAWLVVSVGVGGLITLFLYLITPGTWHAAAGWYGDKQRDETWQRKEQAEVRWGWLIGAVVSVVGGFLLLVLGDYNVSEGQIAVAIFGAVGGLALSLIPLWKWLWSRKPQEP